MYPIKSCFCVCKIAPINEIERILEWNDSSCLQDMYVNVNFALAVVWKVLFCFMSYVKFFRT